MLMLTGIMKDANLDQLSEETHRAQSHRVPNTPSGCVLLCTTNQEAHSVSRVFGESHDIG